MQTTLDEAITRVDFIAHLLPSNVGSDAWVDIIRNITAPTFLGAFLALPAPKPGMPELVTDEQHAAMCHFFGAYMNTGCDEDEAAAETEAVFLRCKGDPTAIYCEAIRYEDM
jgi:hypothetical protein